MYGCTCKDILVMTSMSPQFCTYLYLSDPTQIGRVIKILILLYREYLVRLVSSVSRVNRVRSPENGNAVVIYRSV